MEQFVAKQLSGGVQVSQSLLYVGVLNAFWSKMLFSQVIGEKMRLDPTLCILDVYPDQFAFLGMQKMLLLNGFLEVRRCIDTWWKDQKMCGLS